VTPNGPSYRALPRLYKAVGLWWVQGNALVAEGLLSGLCPYDPTKGRRPLETINPAIWLTRHTSIAADTATILVVECLVRTFPPAEELRLGADMLPGGQAAGLAHGSKDTVAKDWTCPPGPPGPHEYRASWLGSNHEPPDTRL
jgi:hypothetical protein